MSEENLPMIELLEKPVKGKRVMARVYNDTRFPDGEIIYTSSIQSMGPTFVQTKNTRYGVVPVGGTKTEEIVRLLKHWLKNWKQRLRVCLTTF